MQSAICNLQSAVCSLQMSGTGNVVHEPQAGVSTGVSGSPKVSRVILYLHRNTKNTATRKRKKKEKLVIFEYQNVNSLCLRNHYVNSSC